MRILIVFICITMYSNVLGALFGISPSAFNKKVTQLENSDVNLQAGVNNNKTNIKALSDNYIELKADIQANAQVGVGNSVNRDVTNDTGLMKYIVYILGGIITLLIGGLTATITKLFALIEYRDNLKEEKRKYQKELDELRNKGVIT